MVFGGVLLLILEKGGVKIVILGVSCFLLGAHRSLWADLSHPCEKQEVWVHLSTSTSL